MVKISLVGVGNLGSNLAYSLMSNKKIDEIVLVDIDKAKVKGTYLDISHAYPEFSNKLKIGDYEDTERSKIIVITAGVPRTSKTMTRMELLDINKKIVEEIVRSLKLSDDMILIIVTNPVEPLTYITYKTSKLKWNKVIGFGNILDSERLKFILSKKTSVSPEKIFSLVIGEHGENMIPIFSQCKIDEKPLYEYELNTSEITAELKSTAKEIIDTTGATRYGPIRHLETLINSIINNTNQVFPISFFVEKNDFYDISNVCINLPARININGISKIENIELDENEKNKLKELENTLKKIQNGL